MKTYACPGCGDRVQTECEIDCRACNRAMIVLDGIVRGGGVMAIWRDGREVWSGTGLEAVELLADHLQFGGEQAAEADRIVREFSAFEGDGFAFLQFVIGLRAEACEYVAKYPKT